MNSQKVFNKSVYKMGPGETFQQKSILKMKMIVRKAKPTSKGEGIFVIHDPTSDKVTWGSTLYIGGRFKKELAKIPNPKEVHLYCYRNQSSESFEKWIRQKFDATKLVEGGSDLSKLLFIIESNKFYRR